MTWEEKLALEERERRRLAHEINREAPRIRRDDRGRVLGDLSDFRPHTPRHTTGDMIAAQQQHMLHAQQMHHFLAQPPPQQLQAAMQQQHPHFHGAPPPPAYYYGGGSSMPLSSAMPLPPSFVPPPGAAAAMYAAPTPTRGAGATNTTAGDGLDEFRGLDASEMEELTAGGLSDNDSLHNLLGGGGWVVVNGGGGAAGAPAAEGPARLRSATLESFASGSDEASLEGRSLEELRATVRALRAECARQRDRGDAAEAELRLLRAAAAGAGGATVGGGGRRGGRQRPREGQPQPPPPAAG